MTNSWREPPSNPTIEQKAAVNELLQSIGQAPVSTLDTSNPDVSIAWNTLVSTSREVQAEGWTFNTEKNVKLMRSATTGYVNYILLSQARTELRVDLARNVDNQNHSSIIRSDGTNFFLRDKENHSNTWTYDPLCDIVYYYDFETLPIPILTYIIARASTICSSRITGDSSQYQMLKEREDYCRVQAMEYETSQGDYSFFGMDTHKHGYTPYQPIDSLSRF